MEGEQELLKGRNPYDIHFYFSQETEPSALEVRQRLGEKFPFLRFHNVNRNPLGPHPIPMWEADFYNSKDTETDFGAVVGWLMLNHGSHSVLIHPHTGNGLKDHTDNALWLGTPVPLNLNAFKKSE
eukprot:TRINITY_DN8079_c0_g1_i1.p1 TRINITY_DN8079_c0_g1~~TRINITY_DN8079_c0_g1_i1.p1  ORF type:complete len:126 (-),score=14.58 TRINITY_DN8079_c0_g1_i1:101-478(-)